MSQTKQKELAAQAALKYVPQDTVIGIGTGSTVNLFIDALATIKHTIEGAVASSQATAERLRQHHIPLVDLNPVKVSAYFDGTDEFNNFFYLLKGGGGALTREKIIATVAEKFICIADQSKQVTILGKNHPVPVEVIPMARSYVARQMVKLGGEPVYREGFVTDNGNVILDIYNLNILEPAKLEQQIKQITGVVDNGLFAHRLADIILIGTDQGVETLQNK